MFTNLTKIVLASGFSFVVVFGSVSVSVWIYTSSATFQEKLDLQNQKLNLACHICFMYNVTTAVNRSCKSIEQRCLSEGWQRDEKLPTSCEKNKRVKEFVEKEVHQLFRKNFEDFEKHALDPKEQDFLRRAEQSFYAPSRAIIHWSPNVTALRGSARANEWQSITEFERDRSIFTISAGRPNSFDEGKVRITETGMYLIYARLSFECHPQKAHPEKKRIHMEVVAHEKSKHHYVILKDSQSATCSRRGDFVTLFQSGSFRLGKDQKIELKYNAPKGVKLSEEDSLYKSNLGLIRIGLA